MMGCGDIDVVHRLLLYRNNLWNWV